MEELNGKTIEHSEERDKKIRAATLTLHTGQDEKR